MAPHKYLLALGAAFLTIAAAAQDASPLKTSKEKVSYALGMQMNAPSPPAMAEMRTTWAATRQAKLRH